MASQSRLDLVYKAIREGNITITDNVYRQLRQDPEMSGFTPSGIKQELRNFTSGDNGLTVRNEKRPEYIDPDHPFWYRAIIPVPVFPKGDVC